MHFTSRHTTKSLNSKEAIISFIFISPRGTRTEKITKTVERKKLFYTDRQIPRVKEAREFYHTVGSPSMNDIGAILRMNLIKINQL